MKPLFASWIGRSIAAFGGLGAMLSVAYTGFEYGTYVSESSQSLSVEEHRLRGHDEGFKTAEGVLKPRLEAAESELRILRVRNERLTRQFEEQSYAKRQAEEHRLTLEGSVAELSEDLASERMLTKRLTSNVADLEARLSSTQAKVETLSIPSTTAADATADGSTAAVPHTQEIAGDDATDKDKALLYPNRFVRSGKVLFKVNEVRGEGRRVTVDMAVKNENRQSVRLFGGRDIVALDTEGNAYRFSDFSIGESNHIDFWNRGIDLEPDITYRAVAVFDNLPDDLRGLQMFTMDSRSHGDIRLRGLPIRR
ncbi:MAG: hypothetical protein AAFY08_10245 [Planctomycetota bacterium]